MGDVEFDAEGTTAEVSRQYDSFIATLRELRGLGSAGEPAETPKSAPLVEREQRDVQRPHVREADAHRVTRAVVLEDTSEEEEEEGERDSALDEVDALRGMMEGGEEIFESGERGAVVVPWLREAGLTPAQALLVLLFGYILKKREEKLTGIWLMRSFRGSGYDNVERVDELVDGEEVATTGKYRGKRYALTVQGGIQAIEYVDKARVWRELHA